jgi:hypothetical protein
LFSGHGFHEDRRELDLLNFSEVIRPFRWLLEFENDVKGSEIVLGGIDAAKNGGRGTGLKTVMYRKSSDVGLTVEMVNGSSSPKALITFTKLSKSAFETG